MKCLKSNLSFTTPLASQPRLWPHSSSMAALCNLAAGQARMQSNAQVMRWRRTGRQRLELYLLKLQWPDMSTAVLLLWTQGTWKGSWVVACPRRDCHKMARDESYGYVQSTDRVSIILTCYSFDGVWRPRKKNNTRYDHFLRVSEIQGLLRKIWLVISLCGAPGIATWRSRSFDDAIGNYVILMI